MQILMEPGKLYSLFNASGNIEEIKPVGRLPMYCKVYCYGFGMSSKQAAIISGPDQYGNYQAVYISDYEPGFTTLDRHSRPHSKKFGIGHYYDDNLATWPEDVVNGYIEAAIVATAQKEEAERQQAGKDKAELAALPGLYPYLSTDPNKAKANLVAMLKRTFPGVKFSVKKRSYDSYDVDWTDGPTVTEVEEVTRKFVSYETDITGDYRDYSPANFNRIFGGFKYIFESRNQSPEVRALIDQVRELPVCAGEDRYYPEQLLYRIYAKQSLPVGAVITGLEPSGKNCGLVEDIYSLTFTVPEVRAIPHVTTSAGNVQLVDYSEKALAVIGETKPIKDTLKELGGRFNFRLTIDGQQVAGWIFSKKQEQAIKQALGL